jgi:hypothetical protein
MDEVKDLLKEFEESVASLREWACRSKKPLPVRVRGQVIADVVAMEKRLGKIAMSLEPHVQEDDGGKGKDKK